MLKHILCFRRSHIGNMIPLLLQSGQDRSSLNLITNRAIPADQATLFAIRVALPNVLNPAMPLELLGNDIEGVFNPLPSLLRLQQLPATDVLKNRLDFARI